MSVEYRLDREHDVFWIEHEGELSFDDIVGIGVDLVSGSIPAMDTIIDLLGVTSNTISDEQFSEIAANLRRPAMSRAYVAPDFLVDSIARYAAIASVHQPRGAFAVFTTRESALEWILQRRPPHSVQE